MYNEKVTLRLFRMLFFLPTLCNVIFSLLFISQRYLQHYHTTNIIQFIHTHTAGIVLNYNLQDCCNRSFSKSSTNFIFNLWTLDDQYYSNSLHYKITVSENSYRHTFTQLKSRTYHEMSLMLLQIVKCFYLK